MRDNVEELAEEGWQRVRDIEEPKNELAEVVNHYFHHYGLESRESLTLLYIDIVS
ncbi:hypothetical protein LGQ02_10555 [Bacillus shivajii]|uniref:hypothetical protein n=1 Tax=Bacillus shivajii TaxID=1983719 RepID=UPI001CFBEDAF|nr:hypothetical protein [Bacillus shivajii]UCZ55126.1 hypothetical protein LGQ02_10555 [Bacillus shivajii]